MWKLLDSPTEAVHAHTRPSGVSLGPGAYQPRDSEGTSAEPGKAKRAEVVELCSSTQRLRCRYTTPEPD